MIDQSLIMFDQKRFCVKPKLCQTYARCRSDTCFCPECCTGPLGNSNGIATQNEIEAPATVTLTSNQRNAELRKPRCTYRTPVQHRLVLFHDNITEQFHEGQGVPSSIPQIWVWRARHFDTVHLSQAMMTVKCTDPGS